MNPVLPGWWHDPIPEPHPARHGWSNASRATPKCEERSRVHKKTPEKPVGLYAQGKHVTTKFIIWFTLLVQFLENFSNIVIFIQSPGKFPTNIYFPCIPGIIAEC